MSKHSFRRRASSTRSAVDSVRAGTAGGFSESADTPSGLTLIEMLPARFGRTIHSKLHLDLSWLNACGHDANMRLCL